MALLTPVENLEQKNARILAIDTKLEDPAILEAMVLGKMNVDGTVKIAEGSDVTTQVNSLSAERDALYSEMSTGQANLPMLQKGYTQLKATHLSTVWGNRAMQSGAGNRSYTSELGAPNTSTFIYALLSSVLKIYKTSALASLPDAQRVFKIDPSFIPNAKTNFINNPSGCDDVFLYTVTDNAGQDFMIFALQNTSGTNKTFAFDFNGSAYTTNSRLGVFQYTPSLTDAAIYAGGVYTIAGTSIADFTSSASTTNRTTNITVEAGKSSIIVFYSSIKYITTNTAGRDSFIRNIKTNLEAQGLTQNTNIMEIFRRVIEGQRINRTIDFTDLTSVEDVFKYRCGSLIPNYTTNATALAGSEANGNTYYNTTEKALKIVLPEFANNAAALAGGLYIGDVYYNTTLVNEALVV
jgi:hypothetical protein